MEGVLIVQRLTLIRLLLLTAQRREKILSLRWDDIDAKGVWTIRTAKREKGNIGAARLPDEALRIILAQPRFLDNEFVFAGQALNFSREKRDFDKAAGVYGWRLHDLRRTARSLMSRAGVLTEHAELAMGHAVGAIRATYDVLEYVAEKTEPFGAGAGPVHPIRVLAAPQNLRCN
jgi:integrase